MNSKKANKRQHVERTSAKRSSKKWYSDLCAMKSDLVYALTKSPKGTQPNPTRSQEAPRHFATNTSKLGEAFDKLWNEGPHNSNTSTIFVVKKLEIVMLFNDFA